MIAAFIVEKMSSYISGGKAKAQKEKELEAAHSAADLFTAGGCSFLPCFPCGLSVTLAPKVRGKQ